MGGGIVNRIGTYQMALLAKAMSRPFYVVAESHKFCRMYPLTQKDIPWRDRVTEKEMEKERNDDALLTIENDRVRDYTPAEYITLLFTDLGVLTPNAVSDELLKLYQ